MFDQVPLQGIQIPVLRSSHALSEAKRRDAFPCHKGLVLGTSDPLRALLAAAAREFGKESDEWIPTGKSESES